MQTACMGKAGSYNLVKPGHDFSPTLIAKRSFLDPLLAMHVALQSIMIKADLELPDLELPSSSFRLITTQC